MKRFALGVFVLTMVGTAAVLSQNDKGPGKTGFPREERNPVTHLRWNDDPQEFRFAIVSDRTGSHRADIFAQAVEKLNLLQPEFVISVGDLIEGSKKDADLAAQWQEFDSLVGRLQMPFFYVAGNHDVGLAASAKFWQEKLGRRHYHFVYRNVLFLMLNSDDPPGSIGAIGKEQAAYARKALEDNAAVRWTLVFVHRPLWMYSNGDKNGWREIEQALQGRQYTVFAGHHHNYQKFVRYDRNYYMLATTGGGSLRGVEQGEFDHFAWITVKKDGPALANILLDAVYTEDLKKIETNEPVKTARKPTHPVLGKVYFDGVPIPGAQINLVVPKDAEVKGRPAYATVAADGSFLLSTYQANDGAVAGDYQVTVVWQPGRSISTGQRDPNLLPAKYASAEKSGLTATIRPGENKLLLELHK
jgi:hypothetical protein